MDPEVRYTGTLQLKQLVEHRLTECRANPDQAAAWLAAVAYFEDQLHRSRPQTDQSLATCSEPSRAICLEVNQLLSA